MNHSKYRFSMGPRGEGWVLVQAVLFGSLLVLPHQPPISLPLWVRVSGGLLLLLAGLLGTLGLLQLGSNLTPFPRPRQNSELIQHGVFGIVRHPVYTAIVFGTFGGAVVLEHVPGMGMALVLFVFFDLKSRHEERMLGDKFPSYEAYRKRVKKLIPWVY